METMWPWITEFTVIVASGVGLSVFFFERAMNIAFNKKEEGQ